MSDNNENGQGRVGALKTLSIRTEQNTIDRFYAIQDELGLQTANATLLELINRIEVPIRNGKELEEALKSKKNSELEIERLKADLKKQSATIEQLQDEKNKDLARIQQLESDAAAKPNLSDTQRVVSFTVDNLKVLDYVAARESRRRKQQWSISHIINFFIYARFVKGMLNGDLESVGDSELRQLGVNMKTKAREAVEI